MVDSGPTASDSGAVASGDISMRGEMVAGRDINYYQAPEATPMACHALPRAPSDFIGRDEQIGNIRATLSLAQAGPIVVVIANGPGSGKTALAVHVAHLLSEEFPSAQLYVRLGGEGQPDLRPDDALRQLLTQQGVSADMIPADVEGRVALYRSRLGKGSLVVLDNVMSAEQVEMLLPTRAGCVALITSRDALAALEGIVPVELGRLPADEAYALLRTILKPERADTDPDAVREIARLCDDLPLALRIAGSLLTVRSRRRTPLAAFATSLRDEKARLDVLEAGHRGVRASFALSYAALSPEAARLLRLLGVLRVPDIGDDLVVAADGTPGAADALDELIDVHLIEPVGETARVRFHDLMRLFAWERAYEEEPAAEREAALDRAFAWCLDRAATWDACLHPAGDREAYGAALDGFEAERAVFQAVIAQASETGRHGVAWRLAGHLADFFEVRGYWADWLGVARTAVDSATWSADVEGMAWSLHRLSASLRLLRRTPEALETAIQALGHATTDQCRADIHAHLGILYRELHRYDDSVTSLETALEVYRGIGDSYGEGLVLRSLGHVRFWQRDLDQARTELERAVELLSDAGDRGNEAWARNNLLAVQGARWQDGEARAGFERAREIFRAIEHRQGEAWACNHMGKVHQQYGRTADAIECHEEALQAFRELDDAYGMGWALLRLGVARGETVLIREALDTFEEIEEHDGCGWALTLLARESGDAGLTEQALRHFEIIGSLHGQGTALSVRGDLELAAESYGAAEASYGSALEPLRRAADPHREALTLRGLAELDRLAGRDARHNVETARDLMERIGLEGQR